MRGVAMFDAGSDESLVRAARQVLLDNNAGRWTKPSALQYPHQWNWDSGFISLGWATFDWERAALELESMLKARWREGMVPQIHYDKGHLQDYFPGPDRWPHAQSHVMQAGELTSGITNPPILVLSALRIGRRQPDRDRRLKFWETIFDDLVHWLEYLTHQRRLPGSPLIAMVHPWESGCDNSPRWDHLATARLAPQHPYKRKDTQHVAAGQRPTDRDYDAYIGLAELLDQSEYDVNKYRDRSPFCVYDVLLDALWYAAARDLNEMATELGKPVPYDARQLEDFQVAFEETHWDGDLGLYVDWDCVGNRALSRATGPCLTALATGFFSRNRARAVWQRYVSLQGDAVPVCTVPPSDPAFNPTNYWRGPVWLNINWLVIDGLGRSGCVEEARTLRQRTLQLVRTSGFAEYFNAWTGEAAGIDNFSWTAALTLDMLTSEHDT